MATESNVRQSEHGVRTYRGRTLEEILPQIREELGADAIILREREGLVGGVGGFFAQRFVEVEARRGDGQSIDIYDDSPEDDLRLVAAAPEPEVTERDRPRPRDEDEVEPRMPVAPEQPAPATERRQAPAAQPIDRSQPRPFVPPSVRVDQRAAEPAAPPPPEPPQPTRRRFETDVFLERLRAASAVLPDEDEEDFEPRGTAAPVAPARSPEPVVAEPEPPVAEPEPVIAEPEPPVAEPKAPVAEPKASEPAAGLEPRRRPSRPAPPDKTERKPRSPAQRAGRAGQRPKPQATRRAPERAPEPLAEVPAPARTAEPMAPPAPPAPPASLPGASSAPPAANPYEAVRQRPPSLRLGLPVGQPAPRAPAPAPVTPPPAAPPTSQPQGIPRGLPAAPLELRGRRRSDGAIREVLARLLGGRFVHSALPKPSSPRPIDPVAATEIASELATRGASQAWTSELITTAGAHGSPLARSLREAAEAEVARRIVPAPALPVTGAAVAFIGAGGAGKTRCTAALASAYSRGSTLGVTVIALDNPDGARELKRLLSGDGVPVLSLSGERARRAVETARQGGFVIVDTPTATPTDPAAVDALGLLLEPLGLDATFVALPATLGAQAARRALASFGRLHPSAVAITHADETDQLAVVVEIAISHHIPLAYFHAGTDHHTALSAVEASSLAQQLLAS